MSSLTTTIKTIISAIFALGKRFSDRGRPYCLRLLSGFRLAMTRPELEALRESMSVAIGTLKASGLNKGHHGRAARYALPWFMVMGPQRSGKSTLLRYSGLYFPYAKNDTVGSLGLGATNACDWWFANEAVILDTAGRYMDDEQEHREWLGLLQLLKKHRGKMPINGVVLVFNIIDLIRANEAQREAHVNRVRQRIHEMINQLGVNFPVYIVLTHVDGIEGFEAYFKPLSDAEREQYWGVHLDSSTDMSTQLQRFNQLYDRLTRLRLHKMAGDKNVDDINCIIQFPQRMKESIHMLEAFFKCLMNHNPYQESPYFKGVFFTGLKKTDEEALAYFSNHLLKDLILKDDQAGDSQRILRRRSLMTLVAAGVGLLGVILINIMFVHSLEAHTMWARQAQQAIAHMHHGGEPAGFDNASLARLSFFYQSYDRLIQYQQHKPLYMMLTGDKLSDIEEKMAHPFNELMATIVIEPMVESLAVDLADLYARWPLMTREQKIVLYNDYYQALQLYLMISHPAWIKYEPARLLMQQRFSNRVRSHGVLWPLSESQTSQLFTYYLTRSQGLQRSGFMTVHADHHLIENARSMLRDEINPSAIYQPLIMRLIKKYGELNLSDLMKGSDSSMFRTQRTLPVIFTRNAIYQKAMKDITEAAHLASAGDWVLDPSLKPGERAKHYDKKLENILIEQLRTLYFKDYISAWMQFIASIEVEPFRDLDQAIAMMGALAEPKGPYAQLMDLIVDHIQIDEQSSLTDFDATPLLADYCALLKRVQNELIALGASNDISKQADAYARAVFLSKQETELAAAVSSLSLLLETSYRDIRESIEPLLRSAFERSWECILDKATEHLERQWQSEVVVAYNHWLRGKFPFSNTRLEASLEDVANFFSPEEGILHDYMVQYLQPYIHIQRSGLSQQTWLGRGPHFSEPFLKGLEDARRISYGLFRKNSSELRMSFYLAPVPIPGVEELLFDTNGQLYRYRNEPEEWRRFSWPGQSQHGGARIYLAKNAKQDWAEIQYDGLWGFFHLLEQAKLKTDGGAQYMGEWTLISQQGKKVPVKMKLRADKQTNVLEPGVLIGFTLPDRLTEQ